MSPNLCQDALAIGLVFSSAPYSTLTAILLIKPCMLVSLIVSLLVSIMTCADGSDHDTMCVLNRPKMEDFYKEGDFIVGGMIQLTSEHFSLHFDFSKKPRPIPCLMPAAHLYRLLLILRFTVQEINNSPDILPNSTLGYQILDSCGFGDYTVAGTLKILSGNGKIIPNYSCWKKSQILGIIGEQPAKSSHWVPKLAGIYRYPQVSYASMDPVFSDAIQFPSFYQVIPQELSAADAIVKLLKQFGWKWVGLIVSAEESGQRAGEILKKGISSYGGCVAFYIEIRDNFAMLSQKSKLLKKINLSSAKVIVSFLRINFAAAFVETFSDPKPMHKFWIMSLFFKDVPKLRLVDILHTFNGSLAVLFQQGQIPGFKEHFYTLRPADFPNDNHFRNMWEEVAGCNFKDDPEFLLPKCTGNETLDDEYVMLYDFFTFRISYGVYIATYALAHSLHDMATYIVKSENLQFYFKQWKLNAFLKKIHFTTLSGDQIFFDDNRCVPAHFDIVKYYFSPIHIMSAVNVGKYHPSSPAQEQLTMYNISDIWGPLFKQVPQSLCCEPCKPGYKIVKREGESTCCYDCVLCADGEISNTTDSQRCLKCPSFMKPNKQRSQCVPKYIEFLSYKKGLGTILTSISLLFSVTTIAIFGVFWKFNESPIVKANNRNLSYILLVSLMLCFLSSLLFIGRPSTICCLLQQGTFGVVFAVAISSVLAKTLTVIIAFNATKPGSKLKNLLGTRWSIALICLCSSVEILLSLTWIVLYPPFPDADTETDTVFLMCNEGSVAFFFVGIGYIGLLAVISLVAAFLSKDFPDRFNEGKNITISILIFTSVWVAFIPAYLSTKGENMVAVEVFAIMSSSAGLLLCIFFAKCYNICFSPDKYSIKHNSI